MNKVFFKFFIIFLFSFKSYSKNIEFKGLSRLNLDDIQSITSINIFKNTFDENDVNNLLIDIFNSDQIYNASYTSDDKTFYLSIEEAPIIENIYFNGNQYIDDLVFVDVLNSKRNNLLNKKDLSLDLNLIKNIYFSKGFTNVNINISTEKFLNNKINLIFDINEGSQRKINTIKFIGNNSISSKILSSKINTRELNFYNFINTGSNFNESIFNNDLLILKETYKDKGFHNVDVSYLLSNSFLNTFTLNFYINENNRFFISNFIFDFDENINSLDEYHNLVKKMKSQFLKNSQYYDQFIIDDFINSLNDFLLSVNLIYEIDYKVNYIDSENLEISFYSKDLPKIYIKNVDIYGNTITKNNVLLSKIDINPGDLYTNSKVVSSNKKLTNLKYIEKTNYSITNDNNNESVNILFDIVENKKTGSVLLGGSFNGDVGAGIFFTIEDSNFLGSGNETKANVNLNSEETQYDISYKQNLLANSNISNKYSIADKKQDLTSSFGYKSSTQLIGYELQFDYSVNTALSLGYEFRSSKGYAAKNSTDLSITDNIGDFSDSVFSFTLNQNKTNNNLYPSSGYSNNFFLIYSPNELSDNSYVKALYKGDVYLGLDNTENYFFISNRFGLADSLAGRLKTINAFSLGGLNFKGFDYRGIGNFTSSNTYLGGNKFFTTTLGYGSSFIFDNKDNIYIKLFYTTGSLWNSDYINQDFKLRSSIGTSFDVLTPVGPLSFIYAIPIDKENGDLERRFNFTIGTAF